MRRRISIELDQGGQPTAKTRSATKAFQRDGASRPWAEKSPGRAYAGADHSAAGKRAFGAGWRTRLRERKKSPEAVEIGPARSTSRASSNSAGRGRL